MPVRRWDEAGVTLGVERRCDGVTQQSSRSSSADRLIGGLISIASLLLIALIVIALLEGEATGRAETHRSDAAVGPAQGTLVAGTVTGAEGPMADVEVSVTLRPAEEDVEVGQAVELHSLEPVRTDGEGRYVVALPLKDVPAQYLMSGRVVNFDVWLNDAGVGPISTSARHPRAASWWVDVFDQRHDAPKTLDFDLEAMSATEKSGDDSQRWPLIEWRSESDG